MVEAKRHLIVGAGTAGWNAITAIREIDKGASEIILVSGEIPYSRMVLPYYLANEIGESHVVTAGDDRLAALKVTAHFGRRAAKLNPAANLLTLDDGEEIEYDDLLIATGSSPVRAPVPGADGPGVHSFWTLDQAKGVIREAAPGKRVAVIGAGFISFTILNALIKRETKVHIVEIAPRILPRMVDETGAEIVENWLADRGVTVRAGAEVTAIEGEAGGKRLRFREGPEAEADLIIMATGIRTNLEWLEGSGVETGAGVMVDDCLRSSVPNVYAAGDVAEAPDFVTGNPAVHAIEPTAMQHGRVAGANMAGADTPYRGSFLMNIVDLLDLEVASFGNWNDEGAEVFSAVLPERPAYRKLLFRGGQLVGAILIGMVEDVWATNDMGILNGLILSRADLSAWKGRLREDPFDVKRAFVAAGAAGDLLPRTILGRPTVPAGEIAAG
jgi:NAD(P)H-nitrite reductase large subunit